MYLVDLKYRDRDITESSFVFSRSKGGKASGEPLLSQIHEPNLNYAIKCANIKYT